MSSKTNVLIEIKDLSLKEKLADLLAGDWAMAWNLLDAARRPELAATALVGVVDDERSVSMFGQNTTLIFLGAPSSEERFFCSVETGEKASEELHKAIRKAYAYRETTRQNIESLYPNFQGGATLEAIAQSLTARIHQLIRLSEMRMAVVEQMPVGILGIDDEGNIVLANPKAIELLGMEDIPIWGMAAETLIQEAGMAFLKDKDSEETQIIRYGQAITLRKSPFVLENAIAGTILILFRPSPAPQQTGQAI